MSCHGTGRPAPSTDPRRGSFSEILVRVPSARSSSSALFSSGSSPLSLRAANAWSPRSSGMVVTLSRSVGVFGLIGEHGDAVVDDGVHAAVVEHGDGLGEPVDGFDLGAGVACDLGPVAGGVLRGPLALQVRQRLDRVVVLAGDDHALGDRVRLGEVVLLLAFLADRDLVGDDVEAVGLQRREHGVPRRLDEFDVHAELLGDCLGDVDVVAGELSALLRIVERVRRVDAFGADAQHAGGFDRVAAVGVRRTTRRQQQCRQQ